MFILLINVMVVVFKWIIAPAVWPPDGHKTARRRKGHLEASTRPFRDRTDHAGRSDTCRANEPACKNKIGDLPSGIL